MGYAARSHRSQEKAVAAGYQKPTPDGSSLYGHGNRLISPKGFRPAAFRRHLQRRWDRKQQPFGAHIHVLPAEGTVPFSGGTCQFRVTCTTEAYGVESLETWIVVADQGVRSGPSTVVCQVEASDGLARDGTLVIAGKTILVHQVASM